jgi:hypothetical protein
VRNWLDTSPRTRMGARVSMVPAPKRSGG